jgi:ketosteroid isomerase-like protein
MTTIIEQSRQFAMQDPPAAVTVRRFVEAINSQDLARLTALMTDDHVFIDNAGHAFHGRAKMQNAWTSYFSAYPEYRIHVDAILTSGADAAIVGRTTGSHVASDVEQVEIVAWTAKIHDGLVAEWRIYAEPASG